MNHKFSAKLKKEGFPQEPTDKFSGYDGEFTGGRYILIGKEHGEGGETYLLDWEYRKFKERGDTLIKIPRFFELITVANLYTVLKVIIKTCK